MLHDTKHKDANLPASSIQRLIALILQVAQGNYHAAGNLFHITASESETPEIRELADTLGLMSVKIEGREYKLAQTLNELKKKNEELKQNAALRAESGFLFCSVIVLLCLYTIVLAIALFAGWRTDNMETTLSIALLAVLLVFSAVFIKRHHHPWSAWGLTWQGGGRALRESFLFSLPVALAGIGLKWALIRLPASPLFGQPLFEPGPSLLPLLLYALGSIVQEIVNRGVLQTTIERMLTGPYRGVTAIATASLLFAVAHLHYAIPTMLATLLGGFFFGWLFYRHRTLVGVSIVHFLLGVLFLDILRLIG